MGPLSLMERTIVRLSNAQETAVLRARSLTGSGCQAKCRRPACLRRGIIRAVPQRGRLLRDRSIAVRANRSGLCNLPGRSAKGARQHSEQARRKWRPSALLDRLRPVRGAQATNRDIDFWISMFQREGRLAKGKLKTADICTGQAKPKSIERGDERDEHHKRRRGHHTRPLEILHPR